MIKYYSALCISLFFYGCTTEPETTPPTPIVDWVETTPPSMSRVYGIRVSINGDVFAYDDSSLSRSIDTGFSWSVVYPTSSAITGFAIDSMGYLYLSSDDTIKYSQDNGSTWMLLNVLDSNNSLFGLDIHRNGYLYSNGSNGGNGQLYRSTDQGASFQSVLSNFRAIVGRVFISPWSDIYTATSSLLGTSSALNRSTDYGDSWFASGGSNFSIISYEALNPGLILFGTRSNGGSQAVLMQSTDKGITWNWEYGPGRNSHITGIVINTHGELFTSTTRDINDAEDGIFRKTLLDSTWRSFNSGLPGTHIASLVSYRREHLFCVLDSGRLYRTRISTTDTSSIR